MTNYTKNSFTNMNKDEIFKECVKEIESFKDGEFPDNFYIVHSYGEHEEIISTDLDFSEAIDEFISTVNNNEWGDDDYYISIEGNWKENPDDEDGEIGEMWTIYSQQFNQPEDN